MRFITLSFIAVLTSLSSCYGQHVIQNTLKKSNGIDIAKVDTVQELGKNIMLIYQDSKNNYWFGSWEDGLYKYDGVSMLHYTTECGLPNNRIDEIKEDNIGNVYFNTSSGIIKYDGTNFQNLEIVESYDQWKLEPNDLWFKDGWNSGSVFRYDGNFLYKLQLPKTKLGEEYILKNPYTPNPYTIYSIYIDSKKNVWFGTGALGVFRYNGNTFDWILEKDVLEIMNEPYEGSNGVRSIIEDEEGYFWFNSKFRYQVYDSTLTSSNKVDNTFYKREKSIGSLDGKSDGNLVEYLSIAKDTNNELWIATYDAGIYHYNGENIAHFVVKDNSKEIKLFTIYKDNKGNLWLGTPEASAYIFNGKTFEKFNPYGR